MLPSLVDYRLIGGEPTGLIPAGRQEWASDPMLSSTEDARSPGSAWISLQPVTALPARLVGRLPEILYDADDPTRSPGG
jgi:hypothetical protein